MTLVFQSYLEDRCLTGPQWPLFLKVTPPCYKAQIPIKTRGPIWVLGIYIYFFFFFFFWGFWKTTWRMGPHLVVGGGFFGVTNGSPFFSLDQRSTLQDDPPPSRVRWWRISSRSDSNIIGYLKIDAWNTILSFPFGWEGLLYFQRAMTAMSAMLVLGRVYMSYYQPKLHALLYSGNPSKSTIQFAWIKVWSPFKNGVPLPETNSQEIAHETWMVASDGGLKAYFQGRFWLWLLVSGRVNPEILITALYINPYGIGLMRLFPMILWKHMGPVDRPTRSLDVWQFLAPLVALHESGIPSSAGTAPDSWKGETSDWSGGPQDVTDSDNHK